MLWAEAGITAARNRTIPHPALHAVVDTVDLRDRFWCTATWTLCTCTQPTIKTLCSDEAQSNTAWTAVSSHSTHFWGRQSFQFRIFFIFYRLYLRLLKLFLCVVGTQQINADDKLFTGCVSRWHVELLSGFFVRLFSCILQVVCWYTYFQVHLNYDKLVIMPS